MDTKKQIKINQALHSKADMEMLYVNKNEEGRGMVSIEEYEWIEEQWLKSGGTQEDGVLNKIWKVGRCQNPSPLYL